MEKTMSDEVGGTGDGGGVLRASGADADGIERKDGKYDDEDDNESERRCNTDVESGETGCSKRLSPLLP
jgi:hypothetical protein